MGMSFSARTRNADLGNALSTYTQQKTGFQSQRMDPEPGELSEYN